MLNTEIIKQLQQHTAEMILNKDTTQYDYGGNLFAKDVFDENSDIYINFHTKALNSPTNLLHGHDFFEITYVIHGNCEQIIDNYETRTFSAGSVCIMNPNARHNIYVKSEDDMVLNIGLKKTLFTATFWSLLEQNEHLGQFFLDYFLAMDTSNTFLLFDLDVDKHTEEILEFLCRDYLENKPYSQLTLRCTLILFFTEVIRRHSAMISNQKFKDKTSFQITSLFNYLSVNYATATLKSTAAYFHYHPNYLSAFVKKHTGKNFRTILNEIKQNQASFYLANTNMPIKDISEKLGFLQLCNFYDFIKKNFNTTPSKYRQDHHSHSL